MTLTLTLSCGCAQRLKALGAAGELEGRTYAAPPRWLTLTLTLTLTLSPNPQPEP